MRTIASTFSTREEAETAGRRLEEIGVTPDHVVIRDLAEGGDASRGVFVSAKVTPEQVSAASAILKAPQVEPAVISDASDIDEGFRIEEEALTPEPEREPRRIRRVSGPLPAIETGPGAEPVPPVTREPELQRSRPAAPSAPAASTSVARASNGDLKRHIAFACLLVALAFLAGVLLRMIA